MPDYMRIDQNLLDKGSSNHPERVYILSKQENDGWLTVDNTTLNRT